MKQIRLDYGSKKLDTDPEYPNNDSGNISHYNPNIHNLDNKFQKYKQHRLNSVVRLPSIIIT